MSEPHFFHLSLMDAAGFMVQEGRHLADSVTFVGICAVLIVILCEGDKGDDGL